MKPSWLLIAEKEIGVKEVPGPGVEPRIVTYHTATTLHATDDSVPWCAAFVGWSLLQAGIEPTRSAAARSYLHWGREIANPPLGAIVVLSRGENAPPASVLDAPGHVGFLAEREGDRVFLLAGNQHDAVNVTAFPAVRVLGYRWPT